MAFYVFILLLMQLHISSVLETDSISMTSQIFCATGSPSHLQGVGGGKRDAKGLRCHKEAGVWWGLLSPASEQQPPDLNWWSCIQHSTQLRGAHIAVLCHCQNFISRRIMEFLPSVPLLLVDKEWKAQSSQAVSLGVVQFKRSKSASL